MILEVHYHDTKKIERIEINSDRCIVGRSPKSDLPINLECFSRQHFEIEWNQKDFFVTDLNSTNGIYINSERIPNGNKVLFKNFFPIEVGEKVSIFVFADQGDMKNGLDDIFQQSESSFDTKGGETKTKLSGRKGSSPLISLQSSQKSKSTSDQGEKKVSFSAILSVVVVGGAFYLYYSGYFNKPEISTEAAKNPTGQLIVEPAINVTGDELQALMTTNHCSDFGTLCANIKLDRANEMLVATKDKLILYVNYPAFLAQVNSSELAKAAIDLQAEYVLANFAFHPEVIAEARKKNLTYVVVVGIDPVENFVRPKYSLLIDNKSAPPFTVDDHKGYFSGIFFGGTQRMYRKKLKPLLKFSIY